MNITEWTGCYDDNWNGLIIPEAFAHPAKFSRGLIQRIIETGLSRGYWAKGDLIGDPFGGIASGGIVAGYHGLNWIGCELEPRFVDLGNRNLAKHGPQFMQCGASMVKLVQGDSREFAQIVGEAAGIVTSPPYADSVHDGNGIDRSKLTGNPAGPNSQAGNEGYGQTPGQIGALKEGKLDGVVTSPPFTGQSHHGGDTPAARGEGRGAANGAMNTTGYGTHPAQIDELPTGKLDGVVTSPPYEGSIASKEDVLGKMQERLAAKGIGRECGLMRSKGGSFSYKEYQESDGNIGKLTGGLQVCACCGKMLADTQHTPNKTPDSAGLDAQSAPLGVQPAGPDFIQDEPCDDASTAAQESALNLDGASGATNGTSGDPEKRKRPNTKQKSDSAISTCPIQSTTPIITETGKAEVHHGEDLPGESKNDLPSSVTAINADIAEEANCLKSTTSRTRRRPAESGTTLSKTSLVSARDAITESMPQPETLSISAKFAEPATNQEAVYAERVLQSAKQSSIPPNINDGSIKKKVDLCAECVDRISAAEVDEFVIARMCAKQKGAGRNKLATASSDDQETYWEACCKVYEQCRIALRPGGILVVVIKDYVCKGRIVPLCDQTAALLESLGFTVFERCHAMLVKETRHPSLFGGEHVKKTERKSFFRRLAEKKGSPPIDSEEVIWAKSTFPEILEIQTIQEIPRPWEIYT